MTDQPLPPKSNAVARLKTFARKRSIGFSLEIYTDKLGESGRTLFRRAYEQARARNDKELHPYHALVALAEAEPTLFDALLNKLSLDRNELLQSVFREPNRAADRQTGMKISDEFRELLAQSLRHARDHGRREIESTDILFGLFADTRGSIVKLFRKRELEQATVLVEVENLISQ